VVAVDRDDLVATALVAELGDAGGGNAGGRPGSRDAIVLRETGPDRVVVAPVAYRLPLAAGDRLAVTKGGGPGWGSPLERPGAAVREDVLDGYVSVAEARRAYGVVLDPATLAIDQALTNDARLAARTTGSRADDLVGSPNPDARRPSPT
jgi:N-methylhydantoinase B